MLRFLLATLILAIANAQPGGNNPRAPTLSPDQFQEMLPTLDVIVDVRRAEQWAQGHVAGAYFLENLALFGTSDQVTSPANLSGCEYCDIVVYCLLGGRAGRALTHLLDANFSGRLYNGLGVSNLTAAGWELVNGTSQVPACHTDPAASQACYDRWLARQDTSGSTTSFSFDVATVFLWTAVTGYLAFAI